MFTLNNALHAGTIDYTDRHSLRKNAEGTLANLRDSSRHTTTDQRAEDTWSHLDSLGLTWTHSAPLGLNCLNCLS